jgi:hypothetical protein
MARVTPKTNWSGADTPIETDFNRIEGNAQQAFDELDAEVNARAAADNVLDLRITSEMDARIAVDQQLAVAIEAGDNALGLTKLSAFTLGSRVLTTKPVAGGGSFVIPAGVFYFKADSGFILQIYLSTGLWENVFQNYQGMVISDNTNVRAVNLTSGTLNCYLIRIA